MKRLFAMLPFLLLFLTACTPAQGRSLSPNPTPMLNDQAEVQSEPTLVEEIHPTATKKPKGKNPLVVATSTSPDFIATEIMGRPTDKSITMNIVPATAMEVYYEYGTTSGVYTSQTPPQRALANEPLETLIDGLQANTRYYYHINYKGISGVEGSFVTQRAPGSTFTFAIQGDSHPESVKKQFDPDLYARTMLSAAADQPDFYLTIGDDFSVDTLKTINAETVRVLYINQRQYLGLVGAPVFLVNGNHEQASQANLDGTSENVAVWAQNARNAYYPQPAPDDFYTGDTELVEHIGLLRDYYAFTWGDALFVILDPYWHSPVSVDNTFGSKAQDKKKRDLWEITLGDVQYEWFMQTLESSSAKYKFVFAHHVNGTGRGGVEQAHLFEWGGYGKNGQWLFDQKRPGWDAPIHQIMADNQVAIFFQGHDHVFAHQELNGVIYQTLPEPADPNYAHYYDDIYTSGYIFPNSGHVRVTVSPYGVTVDYIRSYLDKPDEVAFTYTTK